jgi:xylulokinase
MHGLVLIDKNRKPLRPAIMGCDTRAVHYGESAFLNIGREKCLTSLLNSPEHFTASKLKWVKENEPKIYRNVYKMMLPGDYIAMKLTGNINTTPSGLSEAVLWDFKKKKPASFLIDYFGFDKEMIPEIVDTFSFQGNLTKNASEELNLPANIVVSYRAGDILNQALSLDVLEPGEVAGSAGFMGSIYAVTDKKKCDPLSRFNTFLHVNDTPKTPRNGILMNINGFGSQYAWLKNIIGSEDYERMNKMASEISVGSEGLLVHPFGNGAEKLMINNNLGAQISNINFNIHNKKHLVRAALEGIVFAFAYGINILQKSGIQINTMKYSYSNLSLSKVFISALATVTNTIIELYETNGAEGAARGAGVGVKFYRNPREALSGIRTLEKVYPEESLMKMYIETYNRWIKKL